MRTCLRTCLRTFIPNPQRLKWIRVGVHPGVRLGISIWVSLRLGISPQVLKQRCQVGQLAQGQKALGLMRQIIQTEGVLAMYTSCCMYTSCFF